LKQIQSIAWDIWLRDILCDGFFFVVRCWLLSTLCEFLRLKIIQSWNLSQLLLV
jgi:hypothetical protein